MVNGITRVKLYYDIVSPYSWFGMESLCKYKKPWNLDIQLRPTFTAKIMKESGNTSPVLNPSKVAMMLRDLERVSGMLGMPYNQLADPVNSLFKRGSLPTIKTLAACQILYPDHLEELSRQAWLGLYSRDIDITSVDNLQYFAEMANIPDVDKLLQFRLGDEARQQVIDNTQEALKSKCFGVPWYTVTNPKTGRQEKLFGHDRLEMLGWIIGKEYKGICPKE